MKKKKILIVKLAALGDILALSPIFRHLKVENQNIILDHLVMENCYSVTKDNIYIDNHIVLDVFPKNIFLDIFKFIIVYFKILFNNYDYIFYFHRNTFLKIFFLACFPGKFFYYKSNCFNFIGTSLTYDVNTNRTIQDFNLINLSDLNISIPNKLDFYFPKIFEFDKFPLPTKFIACNTGGGNYHSDAKNRMWPINHYLNLFDLLSIKVVLLGSGESDLERSHYIKNRISNKDKIIDLVGKTSIAEAAYIISKSNLYLGNDSSFMFLASALNIPAIGLYGPTPTSSASPLGNKVITIRSSLNCSPCYNPYDGLKGKMYTCTNNMCMNTISVLDVYEEIEKFLE